MILASKSSGLINNLGGRFGGGEFLVQICRPTSGLKNNFRKSTRSEDISQEFAGLLGQLSGTAFAEGTQTLWKEKLTVFSMKVPQQL